MLLKLSHEAYLPRPDRDSSTTYAQFHSRTRENGKWWYYEWYEEGSQDKKIVFFSAMVIFWVVFKKMGFFFSAKKSYKKEREQERERFWPFQAEVILYNFVLKTPKPFFLLISAHIQDTQHSSSE